MNISHIQSLTKLVRYNILNSTTTAGSGHPSSSLSATDIMTVLMFGGYFKADLDNPEYHNNDRVIFSKGHAAPLLYSLYAVAGKVSEDELKTLRLIGSKLEGHPTMRFPYTEAATGSLGQGLSVGVGMALNAKQDGLDYNTYVLMGDSEMAEGSVWEAMQIASYYQLNNLVGIIDVNRLGQRGETMYGHDVENYQKKCEAFGWEAFVVDGYDLGEIANVLDKITTSISSKPKIIIAKTFKGAGISFIENKDGWHGKALKQEDYEKAVAELGEVDLSLVGEISKPNSVDPKTHVLPIINNLKTYEIGEKLATRKAYGFALEKLATQNKEVVVLDAETSNSTFADKFKQISEDKFYEMFIAEQNMVGTALGFSRRGKIPFVSTFAAFFTRAFDQIRMSQYSDANIKFVGSHAGISIGEDGASQMALEDISMMRSVSGMDVYYPADAVAMEKMVLKAAESKGNIYIRSTRADTPVIYSDSDEFISGGSKVLKSSDEDLVTVVGAGITLFEALNAYDELLSKGIKIRIIDLYCVKPVDKSAILKAILETSALIVVEDHYKEGGLYSAVCEAIAPESLDTPIYSLSVQKMPQSGKPKELLRYAEIDTQAIVDKVNEIIDF